MRRARAPVSRDRWPWDKVELDAHEVGLLKGVSPAAFAVIEKICGTSRRSPFCAGGEDGRRATDFACGQAWVAQTIRQARDYKLPPRSRGAEPPMPAVEDPKAPEGEA